MLDDGQIKLLNRLDQQVQSCERCELFKSGRAKPYWSPASKFGIIAEAPGSGEVSQNTPLCGTTGIKFWEVMKEFKLHKVEFFIVNSVNCRPVEGNKNGKPTTDEMSACSEWMRKYIRIIKPSKLLVMGKYALSSINQLLNEELFSIDNIVRDSGTQKFIEDYHGVPLSIVSSVHPSWALVYNPVDGLEKLKESIRIFISDEDRAVSQRGSKLY